MVLDASTILALFLTEEHSQATREMYGELETSQPRFGAPDLLVHEVSNGLRKRVRAGLLTSEHAEQALAGLLQMEVRLHPGADLARQALALAIAHEISAYDAAYLALSLRTAASLVSLDRDFRRPAQALGVTLIDPSAD